MSAAEPFYVDLVELLRKHGVENAPELAMFMYTSLRHFVMSMEAITRANADRAAKKPPTDN